MDFYAVAKKYFDRGNYSTDDVKIFVQTGKITEAEYKEITGIDYVK